MSNSDTLNQYSATFILDTRGYKDPVETLIEKLTKTVEAVEGEVKKVTNEGQKNFVRVTDRKFPAGIYVEIKFDGPSSSPAALKEKFRLDRTVNRIFVQAL